MQARVQTLIRSLNVALSHLTSLQKTSLARSAKNLKHAYFSELYLKYKLTNYGSKFDQNELRHKPAWIDISKV